MKNLVGIFFSAIFFLQCNFAQMKRLEVGDKVPLFTLKQTDNTDFNINDYIGKKILVIYFYPKDESAVCTKEACSFRDSYTDFTNAGALVIGINAASVETHKAFQQNHQLPFILLSDPGNKVLKMFGVKNKFFITGRETFVVGLDGKIAYTYTAFMQGKEHSDKALEFIKQMNKKE
ncbi:MAG: peroxiredoxin [Bacteroidetes bacterium]|nr:peroxiredoxin [Bacteroidota bacterium]